MRAVTPIELTPDLPTPVRVAVVDDHAIIRDTIRLAAQSDPRIELVGTARCAAEALSLARLTAPDVIVLDYRLTDGEAPELMRELRDRGCNAAAIVLTSYDERRNVRAAIDAGASGFLTKRSTDFDRLASAVVDAAAGRETLSADALSELLTSIRDQGSDLELELTAREREVWRLVALGRTNGEIARDIFVSERTVKYHISKLLQKTGARTRAELVAVAYRSGLMDSPA